jgi:hypothetical protein
MIWIGGMLVDESGGLVECCETTATTIRSAWLARVNAPDMKTPVATHLPPNYLNPQLSRLVLARSNNVPQRPNRLDIRETVTSDAH